MRSDLVIILFLTIILCAVFHYLILKIKQNQQAKKADKIYRAYLEKIEKQNSCDHFFLATSEGYKVCQYCELVKAL